jgi:hypothetical protein
MVVHRKYFPPLIPDNEEIFLSMLNGVIESVDELCSLQITKLPDGYLFRISPSIPMYNDLLLEEILKFNNLFKIHLDLSKSIKSSAVLSFKISVVS